MRMCPFNYLIDLLFVIDGLHRQTSFSQWIGLNAAGETVFAFQYHRASGL